ncbi:GNAT family N-acetyltransferase [Clostridium beijerinckii]|uniref:GNAT family N-acetyltransferase n=1 Tax=Clostridium beijerinckii TaxID=1520 RepID=UPI00047C544A|nr:GNAT family protein [Clostridium beijerinckii]
MITEGDINIRTIEERDLKVIYEFNSQKTCEDYQEFQFESFRKLQLEYEKDGFCSSEFQILNVEKEEQTIGSLYLSFYRQGIVRIGLVLSSDNCNKGNGTVILNLIVKYIFENYPIVRIEVDTDVENIIAQKLLQKAGFLREGTLRKYRYHHGAYHDSYIYSIIK